MTVRAFQTLDDDRLQSADSYHPVPSLEIEPVPANVSRQDVWIPHSLF